MRLIAFISLGLLSLPSACAHVHSPLAAVGTGYTRLAHGMSYKQLVTPAPNPRVTQVIALDLSGGAWALRVTRGDTSGGKEFMSQTTSSFTRQTRAVIGINGGFFGPVVSDEGVAMDAAGFVVADGQVASPPLDANVESAVVRAVVCFDARAVFIDDLRSCPTRFREGLAAGPRLLTKGVNVANPANTARHPRTALGVSETGDTVWLVITDGRQAGYSEGATLHEMAETLKELGAFEAINLDGGGSSALVFADPVNGLRVLNRPIQNGSPGRERPVATHIGVYPSVP
jgi:exopolysaccharide biosynthesis protein